MNVNDIKLFPHNQDTYNKIQEAWKTSNKVASVQATGTGKSYLQLKCLYNEADKNKIVLAPSNYILEQLESEAGEVLPNTTLMTYADLSINTEDKMNNLSGISLIVLDEFHRCGAESWGTGVQKLLESFPNAKILGTSATNIRFLDNNRDMADELFDGNVVNNLSLAEAIVKKILPMPKYVSALYTFVDEVENLKNKVNNSKNTDEEKEELLKEIDRMKNKLDKSKGIPKILKKHLNENSSDKFIIFCKDSQHLNEMKTVVTDWFKKAKITKKIDIYTAYTGYSDTDKEVEQFKNNNKENVIKLLFSIDMFNEGIHIKDVSGVILLRPTLSPIIYYQQIGRAIQVGKDANPLIFDFVNNFDNIGAKNFISDLKEYLRERRENNNNDNEEFNQEDIEFMIFDEIQEARILFEELEDKLIDNWDVIYHKLRDYKAKYGDCNVSKSHKDKKLGNWVICQRQFYKTGRLTKERFNKLEKIGFKWDVYDTKWEEMYEKLLEYKDKYGDCNIPREYNENKSLGSWVSKQRHDYKIGILSKDKIDKLNNLNFLWSVVKEWEETYKELIDYKNKFGNCNVPCEYKKNKYLSRWVKTQRQNYKDGKLSKEKIKKLNNLNFKWECDSKTAWEKMYNQLVKYQNEFGNCNVANDYKQNNTLSNWVKTQRRYYKTGKLSKERVDKLETLGFEWEVNRSKSGVVGVSFSNKKDKWRSVIIVDKVSISLGSYENKIDAIKARRDAEIKYFGKSNINLDDFKEAE